MNDFLNEYFELYFELSFEVNNFLAWFNEKMNIQNVSARAIKTQCINDIILTLKVWILRIAGARPSDSGHYQCQVAIFILPPSLLSGKKPLTDI